MSPRDGSGVYNTPPGTHGTPNTTILSANYNSNVDDVAADLNTPRPIVAGGTGATTAAGALTALGAVAKAGDTMTGDLIIAAPAPAESALYLNKSTSAGIAAAITGQVAGVSRWSMHLASPDVETGGNIGSNFNLYRISDGGSILSNALTINRASGNATFSNNVSGQIFSSTVASGYNYEFANTGFARSWGFNVLSSGAFDIDDLNTPRQVAQFTPWNGSYATLALPAISTTAVAANCAISSNAFFISTSSIRYKTDIKPLEKVEADRILQFQPVTYRSTSPVDDPDRRWFGFIAEEIAKIEPRLVVWEYAPEDWIDGKDADGKPTRSLREGAVKVPDGLDYGRISVLAVFKLREQESRIAELTSMVDALLARVGALEAA